MRESKKCSERGYHRFIPGGGGDMYCPNCGVGTVNQEVTRVFFGVARGWKRPLSQLPISIQEWQKQMFQNGTSRIETQTTENSNAAHRNRHL